MLKLTGIKKDYVSGDSVVNALKGIDITFRKSEFVSILGPSGCGKTTLLNIVGGLDHYTKGDLVINGISTKEYKDRDWDTYRNHTIGFIFQSYNLIPHLTVLGNVELALTINGQKKDKRKALAIAALEKVGLRDQIHKKPNQLSGGQMQRVAIARAIVNNPDIILADEPTGALDTETSIQVMEILKELSKDRLVIMVTHNPELAEKYSSRLVRLLDGEMISDTNPVEEIEEEELENELKARIAKENRIEDVKKKNEKYSSMDFCTLLNLSEKEDLKLEKELRKDLKKERKAKIAAKKKLAKEKKKKKYSSMSFWTAFTLSLKNLFTKKARMILTSIAGSIGIIGIALVLSLSSGMTNYINKVQRDTLSTYPITIERETMDYSSLLTSLMGSEDDEEYSEDGNVYSKDAMIEMFTGIMSGVKTNNLKAFKKYIEENEEDFEEFVNAIKYAYDIDLNIYDSVTHEKLNPTSVFYDLMKKIFIKTGSASNEQEAEAILNEMGIAGAMQKMNIWTQMLDNQDLLNEQYELVGDDSKWARNYNEIMFVLNDNYTVNDYVLYALGLVTEPTLDEIADNVLAGNKEVKIDPIKYEDIIGRTFKVVIKPDYYQLQGNVWTDISSDKTLLDGVIDDVNTIELKVVGIIKPREDAVAASIDGSMGYTYGLTEEIIKRINNADVIKAQMENPHKNILTGEEFGTATIDDVNNYIDTNFTPSQANAIRQEITNRGLTDEELVQYFVAFQNKEKLESALKSLGYVSEDDPSSISFYCKDFDAKNKVAEMIEDYNKEVVKDPSKGESYKITYTDYVALMMSSVTTIIDAITYVLIAFVSISLIVSSIMIGIITYISVIERTKEIGVLRSLGASKRDVSRVFNAETLILGFAAGALGILVTIFLNVAVLTPIIKALAQIGGIKASLPWIGGIILILISMFLTLIAGLIPSRIAAKRDPVVALRTE